MNKEQLGKISESIIEILGLEKDPEGRENMFLTRDEEGNILEGVDFTDEVIDITQYIDDNFIPIN